MKLNEGQKYGKLTTSDHGCVVAIPLLLGVTVSDECLNQLEGAANLLFGNLGKVHNLTETTRDLVATACEEEAGGDKGVEAFAFGDCVLDSVFV